MSRRLLDRARAEVAAKEALFRAARSRITEAQGAWRRQRARTYAERNHQELVRAGRERERYEERVRSQAAGARAEQALQDGIGALDDRWVLLRGYRNRGDLLVGPLGIWAVEVRRRRVRVHIAGEKWWLEQLGPHGEVVGTAPAVDEFGRTWAQQVNEVAGELARWLGQNGIRPRIRTAVMILHEQARLASCENLTVNAVGTAPGDLIEAIRRFAAPLGDRTQERVLALVRTDHEYHAMQG